MSIEAIEQDFHEKVSSKIRLVQADLERYRVFTPFLFEDGDHLVIVLKKKDGQWVFSDEAHTYMHLTYDLKEKDLQSGTRQEIISNALNTFNVEDCDGELVLEVPDGHWGNALYSFIQSLLKITDVTYLSRQRVHSTFLEDFRAFLEETVPRERRGSDWHDPQHDDEKKYPVDYRINSRSSPLFVHALHNDNKTRDATIALHQFAKWSIPFCSLAVFEDRESINRKVLARFSDVGEKQYSNFSANREKIREFLQNGSKWE